METNLLKCDYSFIDQPIAGVQIANFAFQLIGKKFNLCDSIDIAWQDVAEKRKRDVLKNKEQTPQYYKEYFDCLVSGLIKGHYLKGYRHFLLNLN